ncbi:MAG: hypothetical protein H6595_10525 [Flavobacteriales bacterium]|nr:hypothetical protein [Flavobacteriales bacterium]MCB9167897.1 hypothetical protein [Flavobacteriales bacterium]
MRTTIYGPVLLLLLPSVLIGQTTLFFEDFEGSGAAFTLNTTDAGSQVGGANTWLVNNSFTGGSGDVICLGFPFSYTIANTAAQPSGVLTPNGNYMHITSTEAIADGITNCCFSAADGLCTPAGTHFTRMTNDISTVGQSDVTLSFWWICAGGNNSYGEVYFSTNAGATWTQVTTPFAQYSGQSSWAQQAIVSPSFDGQSTLRFGFRFTNGTSINAQDPAFGIDEVRIEGSTTVPATITTNSTGAPTYCQGATLTVDYSVTGTYGPGNVFTAELSDASGSFVTPTAIGSVAATVATPIPAMIPPGAQPGAGYRVRVTASAPATVGTDNGQDLAIVTAPDAGSDNNVTYCKNTGSYDLFVELGGAPDVGGTWTAPGGVPHSGSFDTDIDNGGAYQYVVGGGVCPADTAVVNVVLDEGPNAGNPVNYAACTNGSPVSLLGLLNGGDPTGIFWYGGAPITQVPSTPGVHAIIYVVYGTAPCVNDTAPFTITVVEAADAGSNATLTICNTAGPTDLFLAIGGAPDPGGSWTDPNGLAHSGTLQPTTDPSGLYTYTVTGTPPCTDDVSALAVLIENCLGLEDPQDPEALSIAAGGAGSVRLTSGGPRHQGALMVQDMQGRTVFGTDLRWSGQVVVSIGSVEAAMYLVRWVPTEGAATFQRLFLGW